LPTTKCEVWCSVVHCIVDLLQCVVVRSARPYPKKKATCGAMLLQCVWFSVVAVLLQCVVVRSARLRPQQKATCGAILLQCCVSVLQVEAVRTPK